MLNSSLTIIEQLTFQEEEKEKFKLEGLGLEWAKRFPDLFDEDDIRLIKSEAQHGYHYYEWRAAIHLREKLGYQSLVEKYQFANHERKQAVFNSNRFISEKILSKLRNIKGMLPDLFVYSENNGDWFFCEVKGPTDKISDAQANQHRQIKKITGKPVGLFTFGKKKENTISSISLGKTNDKHDHFELYFQDPKVEDSNEFLVGKVSQALPGAQFDFVYGYEKLLDKEIIDGEKARELVNNELNFYLVEKNEETPWEYAKYHALTAANLYSNIRWKYIPSKSKL
jgi:hypothetical protein